jgi:hypothetical protein
MNGLLLTSAAYCSIAENHYASYSGTATNSSELSYSFCNLIGVVIQISLHKSLKEETAQT